MQKPPNATSPDHPRRLNHISVELINAYISQNKKGKPSNRQEDVRLQCTPRLADP